ncbi:unnamed protein product [Rotaria magnacalcarata]|uniref:Tetratricopeptide repeat protein n=1 Tax=Rotaria magnacalcarata TaxID=392030 RepID=A0A819ULU3_9BILA|nr:unnamed protein product [Rotaria magnacalcarata]CAF1644447.1 unnamed protein product [Rotaria magnacalcarata]CAF2004482.1 unnamed protein product [Rotaria magnacalcarata]CAF2051805.1 unnamed protein product [Rotaria magnacalcarata]CAF2145146.1 unnamed protein product [Rotaria magnacalcarata]
MNSFLSTSRNLKLALVYFDSSTSDDKFQRVLFDINADPRQDNIKLFADISKISVSQQEEEILIIDNQCELQMIFSYLTNQYDSSSAKLALFGSVLIGMTNFGYAEKYLSRLLKQISSEHKDSYKFYHALGKVSFEKGELAYTYHNIGEIYQKKGEIKETLQSYEKASDIFKQIFADDHENLAWCYNN